MIVLYKAVFLGILGYAYQVWRRAAMTKMVISRLRRVQRQVLPACTRCFRSISYDALYVISGVLPIMLYIKAKCATEDKAAAMADKRWSNGKKSGKRGKEHTLGASDQDQIFRSGWRLRISREDFF